ncbi:MAG: hypothetical protein H6622_06950 [Halobacteriovoraceae bacterium]|nr:hypothetical protein [Halobacteriovoraceae bacterium]
MLNNLFKYLKNRRGMSLIEIMTAFGVTALSILMLTQTKKYFYDQELKKSTGNGFFDKLSITETVEIKPSQFLIDIMGSMNKIIDPNNFLIRNRGVCALVETSQKDPGPGLINLVLPPIGTATSPLHELWLNEITPEYDVIANNDCDSSPDGYNICFKPKPLDSEIATQEEIEAFNKLDTKFLLNVVPLRLVAQDNLTKLIPIAVGNGTDINVKDVFFRFTLFKYWNGSADENGDIERHKISSVDNFWAASVGWCTRFLTLNPGTSNEVTKTQNLVLTGAGFGDSQGKAIYNGNPLDVAYNYSVQNVFEAHALSLYAQEGVKLSNNIDIRTKNDAGSLKSFVCAEKKFKCKKYGYTNRTFGSLPFKMQLSAPERLLTEYPNGVPISNVKFTVANSNGNGADLLNSSGVAVTIAPSNLNITSSTIVEAHFSDDEKMSTFCNSACSSGDGSNYIPSLSFQMADGTPFNSIFSSSGVACTSCYMKSCSRLGLNTFGKMTEMPSEALDSNIPECSSPGIQSLENFNFQFSPAPLPNGIDKCVMINIATDGSESWTYRNSDCAISRPILCYSAGKFRLARSPETNGSTTLLKGSFSQAHDYCFNMGTEVVSKVSISNGFLPMLTTDPRFVELQTNFGSTNSDILKYVNVAKQGIFLPPNAISSPEFSEQMTEIVKEALNINETAIWVAFKADSSGGMLAEPPFLPRTNSTDVRNLPYISYKPGGSVDLKLIPRDTVVTGSSIIPGSSAQGYGSIVNGVRHRGVVVHSTPVGKTLQNYLCMSSSGSFRLRQKSDGTPGTWEEGHEVCNSGGYFFAAPNTGAGWVNALLKVNPHDENYPHPSPDAGAVEAWIGLKIVGGEYLPGDNDTYGGFYYYDNYVFKTGSSCPPIPSGSGGNTTPRSLGVFCKDGDGAFVYQDVTDGGNYTGTCTALGSGSSVAKMSEFAPGKNIKSLLNLYNKVTSSRCVYIDN